MPKQGAPWRARLSVVADGMGGGTMTQLGWVTERPSAPLARDCHPVSNPNQSAQLIRGQDRPEFTSGLLLLNTFIFNLQSGRDGPQWQLVAES